MDIHFSVASPVSRKRRRRILAELDGPLTTSLQWRLTRGARIMSAIDRFKRICSKSSGRPKTFSLGVNMSSSDKEVSLVLSVFWYKVSFCLP